MKMNIDEWIEVRLKELNLTTNQLIESSRVSRATVYKLKSSKTTRTPNGQTLSRLESVLGLYDSNFESDKRYICYFQPEWNLTICNKCGLEKITYQMTNHVDKKLIGVLHGNKGYSVYSGLKPVSVQLCKDCEKYKFPILNLSYPELIKMLINQFKITQNDLSRIIGLSSSMITRLKKREITFIDSLAAERMHDIAFNKKSPAQYERLVLSASSQDTLFFYRVLAKFGYTDILDKSDELSFARLNSYEEIEVKIKNDEITLQPDLKLESKQPVHFGGGWIACFVLTYYDEKVPELFGALINKLNCRYVCFIFPALFPSHIQVPKGYKCFEFKNYQPRGFNDNLSECEIPDRTIPNQERIKWLLNLNNI